MMAKVVAENLRRARRLIEAPHCWGKGNGRKAGSVKLGRCAAIALADTCNFQFEVTPAFAALRKAVGVADDDAFYSWHDAPERTHEDVLRAFDRAIAAEEQQPA